MALRQWSKSRVLGRGSTATVSLASSPRNGELFAVKSAALANSSSLHRERAILSALPPSKHIISYLGYDDTSDANYNLFLEYAPGGSLTGKLADPAIRSRVREILTGLSFLHSAGVVHCDIKSRNILIAADGQAKIADFGCAKFFHEDRPVSGTPMFMAPEVARGDDQGPAADIWAVGCVVIEMATGRAPWPQGSSDAIAVLHRIAFSEDVPDAPEWMSEEGKDFLSRCLRRDPEERPTAEQLLAHPFLLHSDSGNNWTSPKSVLDQHIWESMEEEESAEQDTCVVVEPRGAIAELAGSSSGPNWRWDDEWLTVRTDDCEEIQEAEQLVVDNDHADDQESVIVNTDAELVGSVGADSSANPVNVAANSDTDCDTANYSDECTSSCSSNNNENKIVIRSWNWIYAVIPVGSSLLSLAICCVVSCAFMLDQPKEKLSKKKHILIANFSQWEESHKGVEYRSTCTWLDQSSYNVLIKFRGLNFYPFFFTFYWRWEMLQLALLLGSQCAFHEGRWRAQGSVLHKAAPSMNLTNGTSVWSKLGNYIF